ncbi:MAG: hypothetical protein ACI9MR_004610 [Myxococcota bacterium]|jgi:hypothetical protein
MKRLTKLTALTLSLSLPALLALGLLASPAALAGETPTLEANRLAAGGCFAFSPKAMVFMCTAPRDEVAGRIADMVTVRLNGGIVSTKKWMRVDTDEAALEKLTAKVAKSLAKGDWEAPKVMLTLDKMPQQIGGEIVKRQGEAIVWEVASGKDKGKIVRSVDLLPGKFKGRAIGDLSVKLYFAYGSHVLEIQADIDGDTSMLTHFTPIPGNLYRLPRAAKVDCPANAQCPTGYKYLYPVLDDFCAPPKGENIMATASLNALLWAEKITPDSLRFVFNMYGAFYGYPFKSLDLQAFYYDGAKSGSWLPKSCQEKIKSFAKKGDIPHAFGEARDGVKKLWRDAGKK